MIESMISLNDSYQSMVSYDSGPNMQDSYDSIMNESSATNEKLNDALMDSVEISTSLQEDNDKPEEVFYPPQPIKVVGEHDGIRFFEDGHFWTEVGFTYLFKIMKYVLY